MACQIHSALNRRQTGTARACEPCQFTPLYNTHSYPFLEAKELREANLVGKPFISPFSRVHDNDYRTTDERWLINSDLFFFFLCYSHVLIPHLLVPINT